MTEKRYGIRATVLFFILAGLFLAVAAQPAAAVTPWVRWQISYKFHGAANDIEMNLIVQKGFTTATGQNVIEDEVTEKLNCQTTGTPIIHNGKATFDGSSYFACDVLSVQAIANAEWSVSIPPSCTVAKSPFSIGRVTLEPNPADSSPSNPVFFREDLTFGVPFDAAAQEAEIAVSFGGISARSDAFTIQPAGHLIVAKYDKVGTARFAPMFLQNGVSEASSPATVWGPIQMSNLATTAYIGYSPDSMDYFEGTLGPGRVDPVCTGIG